MGGAEHEGGNRRLFSDDLFCVPRHFQAVGDPLKVGYEQALHLQGNAVLEEIDALCRKLRPYLPQTIGRMLAVCGASEIHPWIDDRLPAAPASSRRLILEELHLAPAMGTADIEDAPRLPIPRILSRTLHGLIRYGG